MKEKIWYVLVGIAIALVSANLAFMLLFAGRVRALEADMLTVATIIQNAQAAAQQQATSQELQTNQTR